MRCVTSAAGVVIFIHFHQSIKHVVVVVRVAGGYVPNCRPTVFVAIAIFVVANIYLSIYPCVRPCGAREFECVDSFTAAHPFQNEGGGLFDGL